MSSYYLITRQNIMNDYIIYKKRYIMNYDRINELKENAYISEFHDIEISDLFLKDENGITYLDYVIENDIKINKFIINKYLSNNYDILKKMIDKDYYLEKYYNIDVLFDKSKGKSLIEQMFVKSPSTVNKLSADFIYKLFEKINNSYMIETFLNLNEFNCIGLINRINDASILYNCFKDINRFELMKYANEKCLLTSINGITILEEMINNNISVNDIVFDKSKDTAKILYENNIYEGLLNMDVNILFNYPNEDNNYLNLLILKYKNGEDIPFNQIKLNYSDNLSLAKAYITLLRNNIILSNYDLIDPLVFDNKKPVIVYMLEMNQEITLKYFNNDKVRNDIIKYLKIQYQINVDNNFNILDIFKYIPDKNKLISNLENINRIGKKDIYDEDLVYKLDNGQTILEYALSNNIDVYKEFPETVKEIISFIKFRKHIFSVPEKLLYEEIDNSKKIIDLLIENNCYSCIRVSVSKDLRIMDYCLKYNNFDIISNDILDELFVNINDKFKAEKYLDNDKFIKILNKYKLSNKKILELYKKGYKFFIEGADEELLLNKYNNETILDDMLNSNIEPNSLDNFKSLQIINILEKHNRYDLFYKADLKILINYPNENNNYLSKLINLYNQGINVNLEKRSYKYNNKEIMSKCYIEMFKARLDGFLDRLEEDDLLEKNDGESLLYYLIKYDKEITLEKILTSKLKRNSRINTELKLLGVNESLLSLSNVNYEPYEIDENCRKIYNQEYSKNIISPVEDLLNKLKELFINDGKSSIDIVDGLITSYRYLTSIDSIFIEEVKSLIKIKEKYKGFYYLKELDTGYFNRLNGVLVENSNISTLNHETGHALHFYLTNYEIPDNYDDLLNGININPNFIKNVSLYSKKYYEIVTTVKQKANEIVEKYILPEELNRDNINNLLNQEKDKIIKQYLDKGYTRETLEIILSESFTLEEFINQKKQVQIGEVIDLIMRYDYDAFIAIGDIIDAITGGKFKSSLLKDENNEIIPPAYGHGIRYYSSTSDPNHFKFTEMIANYSSIIKSKKKDEAILLLRSIVGDELVDALDDFYKNKMLKLHTNEKTR